MTVAFTFFVISEIVSASRSALSIGGHSERATLAVLHRGLNDVVHEIGRVGEEPHERDRLRSLGIRAAESLKGFAHDLVPGQKAARFHLAIDVSLEFFRQMDFDNSFPDSRSRIVGANGAPSGP